MKLNLINGSLEAERASNSNSTLTGWSKYYSAGDNIRMLLLLNTDKEDWEAVLAGGFVHSISGEFTKKFGRIGIPSTIQRDMDTYKPVNKGELDVIAKLAILSKAALLSEKNVQLLAIENNPNLSEAEKDAAKQAKLEEYEGKEEESGSGYKTGGKSPLIGNVRLRRTMVVVCVKLDKNLEPQTNTASVVMFNPSKTRLGEINEFIRNLKKEYERAVAKAPEGVEVPKPTCLELSFSFSQKEQEKKKLGKTAPTPVSYKTMMEIDPEYAESFSKLKDLLRTLPKNAEDVAIRDSSFQPIPDNVLLAKAKVSLLSNLNFDAIRLESDKEYVKKNASVLNIFLPEEKQLQTGESETDEKVAENQAAEGLEEDIADDTPQDLGDIDGIF